VWQKEHTTIQMSDKEAGIGLPTEEIKIRLNGSPVLELCNQEL
jgi:hypothetical protein